MLRGAWKSLHWAKPLSIKVRSGRYQLSWKPYQLYRALSLVGNGFNDKVEIEGGQPLEDLAYGRLFLEMRCWMWKLLPSRWLKSWLSWVFNLWALAWKIPTRLRQPYFVAISVNLLSWGITEIEPMPTVWYDNCAFTFRPWPLIGRFVKWGVKVTCKNSVMWRIFSLLRREGL